MFRASMRMENSSKFSKFSNTDKFSLKAYRLSSLTSGLEFVSSTSADTWVVGRAIIINEIITTLSLLVMHPSIYLANIKSCFEGNTLVTASVTRL